MEIKELSSIQAEIMQQVIDEMIPVHKFLGVTLVEVKLGYALLKLPFRPELVGDPRVSRWHGGIIAALLDSAGGAAAITTLTGEEDQCSSIDIRLDYLRPGKPLDLLAEGKVVRDGSSVLFTTMRAWHPETGETVTEGRAVYRVKRVGSGNALLDAPVSSSEEPSTEE